MPLRLIALALASTLVLAACGTTTDTQGAAAPATVTVTAPPADTSASEPATPPPPTATSKSSASAGSGGGAGCIVVPDVVGQDHQLGQDTMQAAGLHRLDEEDATGQGRLLLYDRNWTVVSQRPAAGTCVSDSTTILLRSKKDGE